MNLQTLKQKVVQEYDRRNLKSDVRYRALDKIVLFLNHKYGEGLECLTKSKDILKDEYEQYKGGTPNSAESSAFNELFNQYSLLQSTEMEEIKVPAKGVPTNSNRDESYVIDLCDEVLGVTADRQHRFIFLVGDSGTPLPVDAYYKEKSLVIEYCERQHTEAVPLFDRRMTVSGVSRGEQRRIYDERRREVLPQHGIRLINISYSDFEYDSNKRIIRDNQRDIRIVKKLLEV